jgi:hypothetical protein
LNLVKRVRELQAFVYVGAVGRLQAFNLAQAPVLLRWGLTAGTRATKRLEI